MHPDDERIERIRAGDPTAFRELVHAHTDRVYNLVARVVSDRVAAEDVTQEVFVKVHRSLDSFNGNSLFTTWLYRVAMNTAKDHLRKRKRRPQGPMFSELGVTPDFVFSGPGHRPGAAQEAEEAAQALLDTLADEQREVFVLREVEGLSYKEIAEVMGTPIGTVESRLARARAALREEGERMLRRLERLEDADRPGS